VCRQSSENERKCWALVKITFLTWVNSSLPTVLSYIFWPGVSPVTTTSTKMKMENDLSHHRALWLAVLEPDVNAHSSIHSDSRKKSDSGFGDVSNTLERKKGSRRKLIVNLQLKSTEPGQERNYLLTKTIIDFLSVMSRAPTAGYAVLF